MTYLYSALILGGVCLIAQLLYEFTKLTPGHITSIYVLIGVLLESFGIYDALLELAPGGMVLPILNFGHLLAHSAVEGALSSGFMGILTSLLIPSSASLVAVTILSVTAAVFKKSHL